MITPQETGNRIQQTRKNAGLTQDALAKMVGVAESTISRYEKGTIGNLKRPVIASIARSLQVSPNWLLGYGEESLTSPENFPFAVELNSFTKDINGKQTRDRFICLSGFGLKVHVVKHESGYNYISVSKDPVFPHSRFEPDIYIHEDDITPVYAYADTGSTRELQAAELDEFAAELQKAKVVIAAINEVIRRLEEL